MERSQAAKQFYDLVWPHRTDVLRVARFLCHDPWVADDLAQETLLKAFRALEAKDVQGTNLRCWLLAILRNTWTDRLRASRGEPAMEALVEEPEGRLAVGADGAADHGADPQASIEAFSDQQIIDALKTLPEEIRWTLLLVDVEGFGVREAAEILDVPAGTVKSRAHRGRVMLRKILFPMARERRWITDVKVPEGTNLRQEES